MFLSCFEFIHIQILLEGGGGEHEHHQKISCGDNGYQELCFEKYLNRICLIFLFLYI